MVMAVYLKCIADSNILDNIILIKEVRDTNQASFFLVIHVNHHKSVTFKKGLYMEPFGAEGKEG